MYASSRLLKKVVQASTPLLGTVVLCCSCATGRVIPSPPVAQVSQVRAPVEVTSDQNADKRLSFADQVSQRFFPYRSGNPHSRGIAPGVALSLDTWQPAENLLPAEILAAVKDGELTILVQDTTDFPVRQEYLNATRSE